MEPRGRNRWQMRRRRKRLRWPKTVAVACDQLPEPFHGKEGVGGSSPSEGSAKRRKSFSVETCRRSSMRWLWSRLWSSQIQTASRIQSRRVRVSIVPIPRALTAEPPAAEQRAQEQPSEPDHEPEHERDRHPIAASLTRSPCRGMNIGNHQRPGRRRPVATLRRSVA
jgi:hypothetical protein